jgi:hypothetical protein
VLILKVDEVVCFLSDRIRLQLFILEELAKSRERIGLRLTLHYLPESEVDGGDIGRCIILGGLVLRFRACSAESAGSEELGSAGAKERAS